MKLKELMGDFLVWIGPILTIFAINIYVYQFFLHFVNQSACIILIIDIIQAEVFKIMLTT